MLRLLPICIIINLQYIFIECSIPSLNVRTVDKKVIDRRRQDTIDMCRIFNAEYKKLKQNTKPRNNKIGGKRRNKRDVGAMNVNPALNDDDAVRVEKIVDKIYDDLQERGEKVTYRHPKAVRPTTKFLNKSRRFNFAPAELLGPSPTRIPPTSIPPKSHNEQLPYSGKMPRFKHGIVPYFIDSKTYDSHLAAIITKAFDYIEKVSCIRLQRLRERPTDMDSLKNVIWLYITNPAGIRQCVHSNDRMEIKGVQMIVFGYDCMSLGDISHEIMHVLGFSHEHSRPDRDQYITILWDNIKPGYKKYFEVIDKPAVDNLPYDYTSVLHYPSRAFSRNGQVTIVTEAGVKIGQRDGLSEIDVEKISMLYSSECVKRNREYLLKTCPTVVKTDIAPKKITQEEIMEYFKDRLWPYGVVNFKLRDNIEFSAEERENINAVMRHIEKETCIEFRDLTTETTATGVDSSSSKEKPDFERHVILEEFKPDSTAEVNETQTSNQLDDDEAEKIDTEEMPGESDNEIKRSDDENIGDENKDTPKHRDNRVRAKKVFKEGTQKGTKSRIKRAVPSPSRRHANSILVFSRSAEPGCSCPNPGKPSGTQVLKINSDCFNSVNDLLHLFVHVLGLDHQHNMYDRDSFLHIVWDQLTPDIRQEMKTTLPPAASVGFHYDYQSVMHYPWLQIKNGRTNMMYPVWNDGWAMGHWQGLSSIDVQKLNLLYFTRCTERKKQIEENKKY